MDGIEYDIFDELEVGYECDCSWERTRAAIASIGRADVMKMFDEQVAEGKEEKLEVVCRFCNKKHYFERTDF